MLEPFKCEACGKLIWKGWFGMFGDRRIKCGPCCTPPRPDYFPAFLDHDPGDEDRTT